LHIYVCLLISVQTESIIHTNFQVDNVYGSQCYATAINLINYVIRVEMSYAQRAENGTA